MFILVFAIIESAIGHDIYPIVINGSDITCDTALQSDRCIIDCNEDNLSIPNLYCLSAGTCIINCSAYQCLSSTQIKSETVAHLVFTSSGKQCVENAHLYLPDNGNATIIADTMSRNPQTMQGLSIHSSGQTSTNGFIYVECRDSSNNVSITNECYGMSIDAQYARYLEININGAEYSGDSAQIICPVDSALSPSCVIRAYNGASTTNLKIFTNKGIPQDLIFVGDATGDYVGMTVSCSRGISTITYGNTFTGNCCVTVEPTIAPSHAPQATEVTGQWLCDDCNDDIVIDSDGVDRVYIEVIYVFSDAIVYELQNIECFLYQLFVEWFQLYEFVNTFSVCSIAITGVSGGNWNSTCTHPPPCLVYGNSTADMDSHSTMKIITNNANLYAAMAQVSRIHLMETSFKQKYRDSFGVLMNVSLYVALQLDDSYSSSGSKWITSTTLTNVALLTGVLLCLCCCCGGFVLFSCYCCRNVIKKRARNHKKVTLEGHEGKEKDTGKKEPNTTNTNETSTVFSGNGPVDIDTAQSPEFGIYNMKSPVAGAPTLNLHPHGLEMMTQNAVFGDAHDNIRSPDSSSVLMEHRMFPHIGIESPKTLLMGKRTYLENNDIGICASPETLLMGKATFLANDDDGRLLDVDKVHNIQYTEDSDSSLSSVSDCVTHDQTSLQAQNSGTATTAKVSHFDIEYTVCK